jgi:hypothetical protein
MSTIVSPKPRTFNADLANLPAALLPLTRLKRWVIWRWEQRGPKSTKPPYQPQYYNEHAESDEPATWGSYEDAVLAIVTGKADGIGFMLKGGELFAIDLDHIRDAATGRVLRWAEELFVEAANAGCYIEWTVSGTGARIIGLSDGDELHRKITVDRKSGCAVEFYRDCARYITVSGLQIAAEYPSLPVPYCREATNQPSATASVPPIPITKRNDTVSPALNTSSKKMACTGTRMASRRRRGHSGARHMMNIGMTYAGFAPKYGVRSRLNTRPVAAVPSPNRSGNTGVGQSAARGSRQTTPTATK